MASHGYEDVTAAPVQALEPARPTAGRHTIDGAAREPLLRRMLALGDALAVVLAIALLSILSADGFGERSWAFALAPVWILLAKLYGLYDRDRQALRHLSVDELPTLFAWSVSGTVTTVALLSVVDGGTTLASAVLVCAVTTTAALIFRSTARYAWRSITAPERVLMLGDGPVAEALVRKFGLFPDIH